MFDKEIMDFLRALAVNNNREWFEANNDFYKRAKLKFEEGAARFIALVQEVDPSVGQMEVKNCTYRIYKDVRFSKDKSPYKINMGAFVVPGGKKSGNAGYYIHLEPDACFFGGGLHCPEPEALLKTRTAIFNDGDGFEAILEKPSFKKSFKGIDCDALKTAPKGFPKDFKQVDLLKFKSYTAGRGLSDDEVFKADFTSKLKMEIAELKPFILFLNEGLKAI